MNAKQLAALIGRHCRVPYANGCSFEARVLDAKTAYGKERIQIAPVTGTGSVWVDRSRVELAAQSLPALAEDVWGVQS